MAHKKSYTLREIAELLDVELVGDGDCRIHGLGSLKRAEPGQLSFLSNPVYRKQLASCKASAIIVMARFVDACPGNALVSEAPYLSYARASALFAQHPASPPQIHPSACVAASAQVHPSAWIGPHAVLEDNARVGAGSRIGANCFIGVDAAVGANCQLHANVTLYRGVRLGDAVIVHAGAVVGADGFGFAFDGARSVKIHQLGGVVIGDEVEIGAGTTIDRGSIDDTVVETGVKIDNQVQIGHNCHIGAHTVICGCTALAGSVRVGEYCVLGGASGAVGHIHIADRVRIGAMSLVSRSINEAGTWVSGTGQMQVNEWKRSVVRFRQLDSMARRLERLEASGARGKSG